MKRRGLISVALAMLVIGPAIGLADWKSELPRKALGNGARAGLQEGMGTVKDAAFDAAVGAVVPERALQAGRGVNAARQATLPDLARTGATAAIDASNMGPTMDTALDAAEAARQTNKARKAI